MTDLGFTIKTWVRGSAADEREGLLGWICVELGPVLIDNITLRRMSDGRIGLSWPRRTAKNGKQHAIVKPLNDELRQRVEAEILGQLGKHVATATGQAVDDA